MEKSRQVVFATCYFLTASEKNIMKKPRLSKSKRSVSQKIGQAPGTLTYIGKQRTDNPIITVIEYDALSINEYNLPINLLDSFTPAADKKLWLNVHGVHDEALIAKIGEKFHLHPLVLEDIVNTEQRPKLEEYGQFLFLEANTYYYTSQTLSIDAEQISFVLFRDKVLITFQERATGAFEPIRERLRAGRQHIRELGVDYLAYSLLDNVVDRYYALAEAMAHDSEQLEDAILHSPNQAHINKIHLLRRASMELRRAVWPLREVLNHLIRNEDEFFKDNTLPYIRDVYDHTVNFLEMIDSIHESLNGLMDIHLTSMSHRVNMEVRALTVVAMLFMPATLIAGIFGMNFEYIPWLKEPDGFWWSLGLMLAIAVIMIIIFWRRQLLSKDDL